MKKYSLRWWLKAGEMNKKAGLQHRRLAKKIIPHIAFTIGYWAA